MGTIRTYGLTHISLGVRDPERSARFYAEVFGAREIYRDEQEIQVQTPGAQDAIAFERIGGAPQARGGMTHFGLRLRNKSDIDAIPAVVEKAGGRVLRRGEFAGGMPFVCITDPDGYEIEIWYE